MNKMISGMWSIVKAALLVVMVIATSIGIGIGYAAGIGEIKYNDLRNQLSMCFNVSNGVESEEEEEEEES